MRESTSETSELSGGESFSVLGSAAVHHCRVCHKHVSLRQAHTDRCHASSSTLKGVHPCLQEIHPCLQACAWCSGLLRLHSLCPAAASLRLCLVSALVSENIVIAARGNESLRPEPGGASGRRARLVLVAHARQPTIAAFVTNTWSLRQAPRLRSRPSSTLKAASTRAFRPFAGVRGSWRLVFTPDCSGELALCSRVHALHPHIAAVCSQHVGGPRQAHRSMSRLQHLKRHVHPGLSGPCWSSQALRLVFQPLQCLCSCLRHHRRISQGPLLEF
jgi:hypothetical protein